MKIVNPLLAPPSKPMTTTPTAQLFNNTMSPEAGLSAVEGISRDLYINALIGMPFRSMKTKDLAALAKDCVRAAIALETALVEVLVPEPVETQEEK